MQRHSSSRTKGQTQALDSPSAFLGLRSPSAPVALTRRAGWLHGDVRASSAAAPCRVGERERGKPLPPSRACLCRHTRPGSGQARFLMEGPGAGVAAWLSIEGPGLASVRARTRRGPDDSWPGSLGPVWDFTGVPETRWRRFCLALEGSSGSRAGRTDTTTARLSARCKTHRGGRGAPHPGPQGSLPCLLAPGDSVIRAALQGGPRPCLQGSACGPVSRPCL